MNLPYTFVLANLLHNLIPEFTSIIGVEQLRVDIAIGENFVEQLLDDSRYTDSVFISEALGPGSLTVMIHACENILILLV